MKVYNIRKSVFWIIFVLILTVPLSRQWRFIFLGEHTRATVLEFERFGYDDVFGDHHLTWANKISYPVADSTIFIHGPHGVEMDSGRQVHIWYNHRDPLDHSMLTVSFLYQGFNGVFTVILAVVWASFYMSYNAYRWKRSGKEK